MSGQGEFQLQVEPRPAQLGSAVREDALRRGDLVLALAVGAGMNSGGALFRY